jgi:hypothetical protein
MDLVTCLTSCTPNVDCDDCIKAWPLHEVGLALATPNCVTAECPACFDAPGCGLEYSSASESCQSCIRASCCKESRTCGFDADCIALEVCVELCKGASACVAKCKTTLPTGAALFDPLAACETMHCPACG